MFLIYQWNSHSHFWSVYIVDAWHTLHTPLCFIAFTPFFNNKQFLSVSSPNCHYYQSYQYKPCMTIKLILWKSITLVIFKLWDMVSRLFDIREHAVMSLVNGLHVTGPGPNNVFSEPNCVRLKLFSLIFSRSLLCHPIMMQNLQCWLHTV